MIVYTAPTEIKFKQSWCGNFSVFFFLLGLCLCWLGPSDKSCNVLLVVKYWCSLQHFMSPCYLKGSRELLRLSSTGRSNDRGYWMITLGIWNRTTLITILWTFRCSIMFFLVYTVSINGNMSLMMSLIVSVDYHFRLSTWVSIFYFIFFYYSKISQ